MKSKLLCLSALVVLCSACSSGYTQTTNSSGYDDSGGHIGGDDTYYPGSGQIFGIDEYEYVIWE